MSCRISSARSSPHAPRGDHDQRFVEAMKMTNSQSPTRTFRALYYPYSRCLKEVDLKRATLVFDELLFVDPLPRDIWDSPRSNLYPEGQIGLRSLQDHERSTSLFGVRYTTHETNSGCDALADTYRSLSKHGIARLVFPAEHLTAWQDILKYAIVYDLSRGIAAGAFPTSRFAHMNFESSRR